MDHRELTLTLPLLDGPLSALQALKGAPVSCLFAMLLTHRPVRQSWLCQATGYSSNSVTAALRLLEYMQLIERAPDRNQGWQISASYAALQVGAQSHQVSQTPHADQCSTSGENNEESAQFAQPSSIRDRVSNSVVESLSKESSTAALKDSTAQIAAQAGRILAASSLLFEERVHGPPSLYPDLTLLLATIAEAHTQRMHLRKPARVVYTNLKNGVVPPKRFLDDPCGYLPANFLRAAGLPISPVDKDASQGEPPDPIPEHQNMQGPPPHPSLALPVNPDGNLQSERSASGAWKIAYLTLKHELPRGVFTRWVEGLELIEFEPEMCVFTLEARSSQARDWLADRLTAKLTQLLAGICARGVGVQFVSRLT